MPIISGLFVIPLPNRIELIEGSKKLYALLWLTREATVECRTTTSRCLVYGVNYLSEVSQKVGAQDFADFDWGERATIPGIDVISELVVKSYRTGINILIDDKPWKSTGYPWIELSFDLHLPRVEPVLEVQEVG